MDLEDDGGEDDDAEEIKQNNDDLYKTASIKVLFANGHLAKKCNIVIFKIKR